MAKQYQLGPTVRLSNRLMQTLARRGLGPPQTWVWETTGRRSGVRRTTPVSPIVVDGTRYLVAPYGDVGWVHNVRASGEGWLSRGRRRDHVRTVEADAIDAGPVLKAYVEREPFVRPYFDVAAHAPVEAFEAEAPRHPVFRLDPPSRDGG